MIRKLRFSSAWENSETTWNYMLTPQRARLANFYSTCCDFPRLIGRWKCCWSHSDHLCVVLDDFFFHHDLMWQNCCNLFLLINDNNSLERAAARSAGIWPPAGGLVLVGGNCRWRGQNGISCSSYTIPRWRQPSANGWLKDNRNCCRSMHAPMTALLCDCVGV